MKSKHLFIFAKISPKNEYFKRAKEALLNIIESTKKEEGCIKFDLHDDEQNLYLYEEWVNELSLNQHHEKKYTKEVFVKYQIWLSKPVEVIKMYRTIDDK